MVDRVEASLALGDGPRLLILGHADTVWPAGTAAAWGFERREEMASGPGIGDMKACVVMAIHAIAAALKAGLEGIGTIEMLLVPDEDGQHRLAQLDRTAGGGSRRVPRTRGWLAR